MKRFLTIIFLLFMAMSLKAFEDDSHNFSISINNSSISINKYLGNSSSFDIPRELFYNNVKYPVTELKGSSSSSVIPENCEITDIFIPSTITSIYRVIQNNLYLKRVIIENGDKLTACKQCIFYDALCYVDYIIVFNNSKNNYYSSDWAAGNVSFVGAEINLKYFDKNYNDETIKMYFRYTTGVLFNEEKFDYLISAIRNRGTDINAISDITIKTYKSSSETYKYNFNFTSNPANKLAYGAKVFIGSSSTPYVSTNPVIPDKADFTPPVTDITGDITYNRSYTQNWNSVCLPFDIKESDFDGSSKIYTVTAVTNERINLTRVDSENPVVAAGTPCFIYSTAENWTLNLSDVTISKDVAPIPFPVGENWEVIGSFTNKTIGAGKYKLNSDGDEFGITNSEEATVTAFRCYINYTGQNGAPNRLSVNIEEEASITLVPNDAEPQKVKLYDLMGRPRKEGSKGFFIKSTR